MKIFIQLLLLSVLLLGLSGCVYRDGQFVRAHLWDGDHQVTGITTNPEYVAFVSIEPYPYYWLDNECDIWSVPRHKGCKPAGGGHR